MIVASLEMSDEPKIMPDYKCNHLTVYLKSTPSSDYQFRNEAVQVVFCPFGTIKYFFVILHKEYTSLKLRRLDELPRLLVMSWQPS